MAAVGKSDELEQTLGVLGAVEAHESLTQRRLAHELGVALGLANALVKRCVRKGLIKVRDVPAGRYSYYLTPKGFSEKSRLTADYLSTSLSFFRRARTETADLFAEVQARGWERVVLAGAGDLAEIASLAARETGIEPVAILDAGDNRATLAGMPIVRSIDHIDTMDGVIVTDIRTPQNTFDELVQRYGADLVIAPPLLRVSESRPIPLKEAI